MGVSVWETAKTGMSPGTIPALIFSYVSLSLNQCLLPAFSPRSSVALVRGTGRVFVGIYKQDICCARSTSYNVGGQARHGAVVCHGVRQTLGAHAMPFELPRLHDQHLARCPPPSRMQYP